VVTLGEIKVVNYIDIGGEDILFDSLPEDKQRKVAEAIQDRVMNAAGYRRKTA
jgi:hypothetical protein